MPRLLNAWEQLAELEVAADDAARALDLARSRRRRYLACDPADRQEWLRRESPGSASLTDLNALIRIGADHLDRVVAARDHLSRCLALAVDGDLAGLAATCPAVVEARRTSPDSLHNVA